jgi:uncharacterized membrane protein (UPF0127 family)
MNRALRAAVLLSLLAVLPAFAASFERSAITIHTRSATRRLNVEVAVTLEQREQGLMGRESLAPDAGMLFVFEEERVASMWMHDTRIPLDMLFLASDGRVVKIAARVKPMSDDVISSERPVRGVLELSAGSAERLGIAPGDQVMHPSLASGAGSRKHQ